MTLQAIRKDTIEQARAHAIEQSKTHPERFYYIKFHTSGRYLVDFIGISYSNENLVETYKNGVLQNVVK